jgi:hypothetical protein
MGRPSPRSSLLAHPGAKFFCGQRGLVPPARKSPCEGTLSEIFSFGFSSLAKRGRSGPQQSRGAPFSGAASAYPLTARTRCGTLRQGGKDPVFNTADFYTMRAL